MKRVAFLLLLHACLLASPRLAAAGSSSRRELQTLPTRLSCSGSRHSNIEICSAPPRPCSPSPLPVLPATSCPAGVVCPAGATCVVDGNGYPFCKCAAGQAIINGVCAPAASWAEVGTNVVLYNQPNYANSPTTLAPAVLRGAAPNSSACVNLPAAFNGTIKSVRIMWNVNDGVADHLVCGKLFFWDKPNCCCSGSGYQIPGGNASGIIAVGRSISCQAAIATNTFPCATKNCPVNAACSVVNGAAVCTCNAGYSMVGGQCVVADPCTGYTCPANSSCSNVNGVATCTCNTGYQMVNGQCVGESTPFTSPCESPPILHPPTFTLSCPITSPHSCHLFCSPFPPSILPLLPSPPIFPLFLTNTNICWLPCLPPSLPLLSLPPAPDPCAGFSCPANSACSNVNGVATCTCSTAGYQMVNGQCVGVLTTFDLVLSSPTSSRSPRPCVHVTYTTRVEPSPAVTHPHPFQRLVSPSPRPLLVRAAITDPCASTTCPAKATCSSVNRVATCVCAVGYTLVSGACQPLHPFPAHLPAPFAPHPPGRSSSPYFTLSLSSTAPSSPHPTSGRPLLVGDMPGQLHMLLLQWRRQVRLPWSVPFSPPSSSTVYLPALLASFSLHPSPKCRLPCSLPSLPPSPNFPPVSPPPPAGNMQICATGNSLRASPLGAMQQRWRIRTIWTTTTQPGRRWALSPSSGTPPVSAPLALVCASASCHGPWVRPPASQRACCAVCWHWVVVLSSQASPPARTACVHPGTSPHRHPSLPPLQPQCSLHPLYVSTSLLAPLLLAPLFLAPVEADAQAWATVLTNSTYNCGLSHGGNPGEGQNLAGGKPAGHYSSAEAVSWWVGEAALYSLAAVKNGCSTGNFSDCGHYTQVIWNGTLTVGCAKASCGTAADVWACNYYPAGNIIGQPPYVQDPCYRVACPSTATCTVRYGQPMCVCGAGQVLVNNATCQPDPCTSGTTTCPGNLVCDGSSGTAQCACPTGLVPVTNDSCVPPACVGAVCPAQATCAVDGSGYPFCQCPTGWYMGSNVCVQGTPAAVAATSLAIYNTASYTTTAPALGPTLVRTGLPVNSSHASCVDIPGGIAAASLRVLWNVPDSTGAPKQSCRLVYFWTSTSCYGSATGYYRPTGDVTNFDTTSGNVALVKAVACAS
ncbi:unnamed protein product [Closterium sp. Naga37s-1]|nr:unnamed protein product [Closterium sp. Naga37s-1]